MKKLKQKLYKAIMDKADIILIQFRKEKDLCN